MLPVTALEVELDAQLELARIEGGGRLAVVATRTGALVEGVDDIEERVGRRFVEAIEEIEAFGDHIKIQVLAKAYLAREAQVERRVMMRDADVAPQRAGGELPVDDERRAAGRAGHAQRAVGQDGRSVGLVRLIVVRVEVGQNVEGPPRRDFKDRRDDEVGQEAMEAIALVPIFGRGEHATEDEAVALIKQRVGALGAEVAVVLREQERLQV